MNFLVIFPVIVTAMAASIPIESSSLTGLPSSIHSFSVAAEGRQDFAWISEAIGTSLFGAVFGSNLKNQIKIEVIACIFFGSCSGNNVEVKLDNPTAMVHNLANMNLQNSAIRNLYQKNHFDEIVIGSEVNPINQESPFPFAVPALWNPYVSVPLVARQNEGPYVYQPSAGTFIPHFNSFARFSNPSFMNAAAQQEKVLTPANTVLETTTY